MQQDTSFQHEGGGAQAQHPPRPAASERGERGTYDPQSGEVHGSGSGTGSGGNPREDYDSDTAATARDDRPGKPISIGEAERRPEDKFQGGPK